MSPRPAYRSSRAAHLTTRCRARVIGLVDTLSAPSSSYSFNFIKNFAITLHLRLVSLVAKLFPTGF